MIVASAGLRSLLLAGMVASAPADGQVDQICRADVSHVRELLAAADRRYEQRFADQEKLLAGADRAAKEAAAITRKETDEKLAELTRQLHELQMRLDKSEGQGSGAWNLWVLIGGFLLLLIAAIGLALRQRK